MPAIGSIAFDLDDGFDSGVALLLSKHSDEVVSARYKDCMLLASPGVPYVICRFNGAASEEEAFSKGSLLLQGALDVLSMCGRGDLLTREAEDEYLAWWGSSSSNRFAYVTTVSLPVKVSLGAITVHDENGSVVPSVPVVPQHHIGFRFYRLSQASDDLYDAYRNMYLAFESLLSSRYPKGKGYEITWLKDSLAAASHDLRLADLAAPGTVDVVDHIISVIYDGARLPLFHAKDGKAYFAPVQNASDRSSVIDAMATLTQIVIRMAESWYSTRRLGGWVNLEIFESHNSTLFSGVQFRLTDNPDFSLEDSLRSGSVANGVPFGASLNEFHGSERRQNLSGVLDAAGWAGRGPLRALYVVNEKTPLLAASPEVAIDLNGWGAIELKIFIRALNASQPRYVYSR